MTLPMDMKHANVVPEPSIYCPRVLMTPFGPAPDLRIVTEPKMKPMMRPTVPPIIAPILSLSNVDGPPILLLAGTGILAIR